MARAMSGDGSVRINLCRGYGTAPYTLSAKPSVSDRVEVRLVGPCRVVWLCEYLIQPQGNTQRVDAPQGFGVADPLPIVLNSTLTTIGPAGVRSEYPQGPMGVTS